MFPLAAPTFGEGAFCALVLACISAAIYLGRLHFRFCEKVLADNRAGYSEALGEMRAVTQRVLVLQGLNPHVVDPQQFGPTGVAREDEEKLATAAAAAQESANSVLTEEAEALREAETLFFSKLDELRESGGGRGDSEPYQQNQA